MHHDRRDYSSHRSHHHHHRRGGGGRRGGRWRGGGGGGPRRSGNRFQAEQQKDPQQEMISNLQSMLTGFQFHDTDRVKNAQMLASVVCGSNAEQFLGCNTDSNKDVLTKFSPMVVQLVHCVSVWPTETALYAALTLLLHETSASVLLSNTNEQQQQQQPFAQRCLSYALLLLGRDLDAALLHSDAAALIRCRCLLAYLILTAQQGMVPLHQDTTDNVDSMDAFLVPAAIQQSPLPSISALLQALVVAAQQAETRRLLSVAYSLCGLLLDVVPYWPSASEQQQQHSEWIEQQIVAPVQDIMARSYQSPYEPGLGRSAILLQSPVLEDGGEEDDEDDPEDEEDADAPAPACDSLQDALRAIQDHLGATPTKLATFTDTPWKDMTGPPKNDSSEMDVNPDEADADQQQPLVYASRTDPAVEIHIFPVCQSITALLTNNTSNVVLPSQQQHPSLGIMGRFPVFGPPGADDDEEDEDDGETAMDTAATTVSPRLKSYQDNYTNTDRYFCGALIRDILFTQHPSVSATGIEHGSMKQAAERIWNVRHLHPSDGMEYCILETLLTVLLVVQADDHAVYVSRVILELTKLAPKFYTAAILTAVSTIYEDYMPSLTPRSRSALASWLAFHLTHTDYQWPSAYWKHWEETTTASGSSRTLFCQQLVADLSDAVTNPKESLAEDCFPADSKFVQQLKGSSEGKMEEETEFMTDLRSRLGKSKEDDPDALLQHLQSSEHEDKLQALLTAMLYARDERADILGAFADHLGYARPVLLGLVADDVATGETRILRLVEQIVDDARPLVSGILQVLVCSSTVSVQGVFSWIFDAARHSPMPRWWETALLALRLGLETTVKMGTAGDDLAAEALNFYDPLLSGALRGISALISSHTQQAQGKRIPIEQIELIEGFKYLVCGAETMFLGLASSSPTPESTAVTLQDSWNESTVSGPRLASLLDAGGLPAIDMLRGILERL